VRETNRTKEEISRAEDAVRRHNAVVIYSKDIKPSVHAPEEDFGEVYKKALERLARREQNKLR